MKVIRFLIVLISFAVIISSCKKDNQFTVKGRITHAEGKTIYLGELLLNSNINLIDSTEIDKNGEFKLKGESSIPTYYLLELDKNGPDVKSITLIIDSLENVEVDADYANFSTQYNVQGSPGSILVKELNDHLFVTHHKLDSLRTLGDLSKNAPDYLENKANWDKQYNEIVQEQVDYSTNFVMKNPFSMASILALYQKFYGKDYVINDLQTMQVAASALHSIYPNSSHVEALYQNTLRIMDQQKKAKLQKFIQENGVNSPDLVLPDPDGKEIALSSLRGKVVLLQFWSAVDKNSRILNEALTEAYKKFKNKGFEIYQVSVDDNRIEWVDAIDKDKLTWINVGDMKGSVMAKQVYNIQTIPYNYLMDAEGRILAANLKGPDLDRMLSNIFNN